MNPDRAQVAALGRDVLPPDILASAMTDRVHHDIGRGRPVQVSRAPIQHTPPAPDWWHGPFTSADAELVSRPTDVPTPTIPPRKQP